MILTVLWACFLGASIICNIIAIKKCLFNLSLFAIGFAAISTIFPILQLIGVSC